MKNWYVMSVGCVAALLVSGCSEQRPEGMPELYPATLTVVQDGQPLPEATVSLFAEDASLNRWPAGGVTDESGVATLMTYSKYPGVPAGTFKVMVNKTVTEGDPIPEPPAANATMEERAAYDRAIKTGSFEAFQVVAKEFRTAGTTPLTVTVSADADNDLSVDIGAAVKEKDVQASATGGGGGDYVPMGTDS
ncbi:carboxypeptidase regulatory-like domain-containing protein [Roseimaritima sediminicola]|uniref:carboxypeptidase regulatory-like domain-containing protein n=1 Tax=Roseimaritima sediminicola TaxID=2662066 RepID=UPI0012983149|nr:carboxypeptidase regulatory-like domain-containing protein [Roseimaritima sediminicola]